MRALTLAGLLLLAACDSDTMGEDGDRSNQWSISNSPGLIAIQRSSGSLLVNVVTRAPTALRMACTSDGQFRTSLELTRPDPSSPDLILAVGDRVRALKAGSFSRNGRTFMTGTAPIDEALLALLAQPEPVSASFGKGRVGPFAAPFDNVTADFVAGCQQFMTPAAASR